MKYITQNVQQKTSAKGSVYYVMSLLDEQEVIHDKVSTFDPVIDGQELNGEIIQKGDFKNFQSARKVSGSNFASGKKDESIAKFQEKKEQSIAKAQDRAAWMYAKSNATTLIAAFMAQGHQFSGIDIMLASTEMLATKIYNAEPTEPFSSPAIRPAHTMSGKEKVNQTTAEKIFDEGLTDEELVSLDDIPF